MVWHDFGRYKPVRFARQASEIFCQSLPLTMKKTSQNAVNGCFNANPLRDGVEPPAGKPLGTDQLTEPSSTRFCRSKDSLPKKCNLSRVSPNRGGKMLRSPLQHAGGIICQTFQLTMKNTSRDRTGLNFRQRGTRGQKSCRQGWPPPVGLAMAVKSNRLPGKLGRSQLTLLGGGGYLHGKSRLAFGGQGHRHNHFRSMNVLPQKHNLSGVLPGFGRYNFVRPVNKGAEDFCQTRPVNERKEPKNTAKTQRKPPPESQAGGYGFLDLGSAANFLQGLQRLSAVSRQSPGDGENHFRPAGDAGNPNAFCVLDTPLPFCLSAGFPFDGRIDGQNKKTLCFKMKLSVLKNS